MVAGHVDEVVGERDTVERLLLSVSVGRSGLGGLQGAVLQSLWLCYTVAVTDDCGKGRDEFAQLLNK